MRQGNSGVGRNVVDSLCKSPGVSLPHDSCFGVGNGSVRLRTATTPSPGWVEGNPVHVHATDVVFSGARRFMPILVERLCRDAIGGEDVDLVSRVHKRLCESLCVALGTPNGRCVRVGGEDDSHVQVPCDLPVR